jgi:hypothetical protein
MLASPLAPGLDHAADAVSGWGRAGRRHQLERHVVEGEKHGFGAVVLVLPARSAPEQQFIGFGAGLDVPKQHDDVVQAGDHPGNPCIEK